MDRAKLATDQFKRANEEVAQKIQKGIREPDFLPTPLTHSVALNSDLAFTDTRLYVQAQSQENGSMCGYFMCMCLRAHDNTPLRMSTPCYLLCACAIHALYMKEQKWQQSNIEDSSEKRSQLKCIPSLFHALTRNIHTYKHYSATVSVSYFKKLKKSSLFLHVGLVL